MIKIKMLTLVSYIEGKTQTSKSGALIVLHQNHSIWLGNQFSQPNPELGPLKASFEPNSIN